ncbi:MAG: outer membrane protein assembly factor BamA [Acidobacteria bacterium]|nr:outer membrane protein assembly factor BamA [Acidobacteriota bacterium]
MRNASGREWLSRARPHLFSGTSKTSILRVLLFFLGLASCPYPIFGQENNLVVDIVVHGNRSVPRDVILAHVFTHKGDLYDPASILRDFNSLWNTQFFEDIRIEREATSKGWILHIYVKERSRIKEINYLGISAISKSDILDRFKQDKVSLSAESQYDPTKVMKAATVIRQLESEHGHQFATIRPEVRPIPPASVGLTFVVREGPKVKVGRIRFVGNRHVKSRELRHAMHFLRPIGVPHSIFLENLMAKTYDATKLEDDVELVREALQNRGYFKANVGTPETKIRDTGHQGFHVPLLQHGSGKAMDITLPIEEGEQYRLAKITFKGNKAISNEKALRAQFAIKDGDIFNRQKFAKGLENLKNAYGTQGYINFSSVPYPDFDEQKKLVSFEIDVDEGKQFTVRRIEFEGNTTTRDKVIRRELLLEEGQLYNEQYWKLSIQRLNQLGFFEQIKPEDPSVTERHLDDKAGSVDLTLKLKEKGKNQIGLSGGVSGLAGSFIGLSYTTNNFLGLGETLTVQANIGSLERDITFGFTEPYLFDRPLTAGFTVYGRKLSYDQARTSALITGQVLNVSEAQLQSLQNYTQSSKGFSLTASYPLPRRFGIGKRVGATYSYDISSLVALTTASKNLFNFLAFSGVSGPNALNGIVTSKILLDYTQNTLDAALYPHSGSEYFAGIEFSGLGGTVRTIRPLFDYKHFIPLQQNRRNALGLHFSASYLSGFGGLVSPPFQRFYMGGENDLRGFDIRSISPVAFLPTASSVALRNPDGSIVPKNPSLPPSTTNQYTVPIPLDQITFPGGDMSLFANAEYRITIAGPVAISPFMDFGFDPILRGSQLRINNGQFTTINNTTFGCPQQDPITFNCLGGQKFQFSQNLSVLNSTNWQPRVSTGLELQVFLPVVNAPFRIYWAYNPLRLNDLSQSPVPITRSMFPQCPGPLCGAGDYSFQLTRNTFSPQYQLREPRKTFRFSVGTTF